MTEIERLAAIVRERDAMVRAAKVKEDEAERARTTARKARVDAENALNEAEADLCKAARGETDREVAAAMDKRF